eukprot:11863724-Alexandrium_andersonii.AAC.1
MPRADSSLQEVSFNRLRSLRLVPRVGLDLYGWPSPQVDAGAAAPAGGAGTGPAAATEVRAAGQWPGGDPFRAGGRR